MSPRTLRRIVFGFAAGTLAGWATGLLRPPRRLDPDTSLGSAARLPQEEFGEPPVPATVASTPVAAGSTSSEAGADEVPAAVANPTPAGSNVAMTAAGPVDATAAVEAGAPGLTTPAAPIPTPAALANVPRAGSSPKPARPRQPRAPRAPRASDTGTASSADAGADTPPAGTA